MKAKKQKDLKVLGQVDHFFGKISVAAMKLKQPLKVGDRIQIKGATTDFEEIIDSMQTNHTDMKSARKGQEIGFTVKSKVRVGDTVYLLPLLEKTEAPKEEFQRVEPSLWQLPREKRVKKPISIAPPILTPRPKVSQPMLKPSSKTPIVKPIVKKTPKQEDLGGRKFIAF
jgi:putative protease